ncbi:MAG: hypothetical protein FWH15_01165 [Betaproteobacteria bacterium]|nr:hypothetical protein [Betaproteobacteria bacterium]
MRYSNSRNKKITHYRQAPASKVEVEAYLLKDTPLPGAERVDAWLAERSCYRGIRFYRVLEP